MEKVLEKEEQIDISTFATETRKLIQNLAERLLLIGVLDKSNPIYCEEVSVIIEKYEALVIVLAALEIKPFGQGFETIFDDNKDLMRELFDAFKLKGLTIRSDLDNFDERVLVIARNFGEVNMRLQKLQNIISRKFEIPEQCPKINKPDVLKSLNAEVAILKDENGKLRMFIAGAVFSVLALSGSCLYFTIINNGERRKQNKIIHQFKREEAEQRRIQHNLRRRIKIAEETLLDQFKGAQVEQVGTKGPLTPNERKVLNFCLKETLKIQCGEEFHKIELPPSK